MIKLERIQTSPYEVSYKQPNGNMLTYRWIGAKLRGSTIERNIVEVEDFVYEWLKYDTACFQNKKLTVVEDEQKEELQYVLTEEEQVPFHTVEEVISLLGGTAKELKAVVAKISEEEVRNFVRIAKETNLDSSSKKKVLADKLGLPTSILFNEED